MIRIWVVMILLLSGPVSGIELDLREANVTGVSYTNSGSSYTFDVTLIHDDDGEAPSYANLWVVEDLDDNELIRRDLLHSHGTQEFTRSASGNIPDDVTKLVVRGYDQLHGWGGQVALVDLVEGFIRYVDQRSERQDFEESDFEDKTQPSESTQDKALFPVTIAVFIIFFFTHTRRENLL